MRKMEWSSAQQTTEDLCHLLQSLDEELHLLTEDLLPPLRSAPSGGPSAGSPWVSPTGTPTGAAAIPALSPAEDTAKMRERRAERRYELMGECVNVCVSLGKELHRKIDQQPPLRNSTSGSRVTCAKLTTRNLEALRDEMLALQALKHQLL